MKFLKLIKKIRSRDVFHNNTSLEDKIVQYDSETKILETGSNLNGEWTKYSDGKLIVTQKYTRSISTWGTWGGCYSAILGAPPAYPIEFIEAPVVTYGIEHNLNNCWYYPMSGSSNRFTSPQIGIVRPNAAQSRNSNSRS